MLLSTSGNLQRANIFVVVKKRILPITRVLLLIVCLSYMFVGACNSQVLPFKNYTMKDGLISNNIESIFQDSRGYLWIGTFTGISVYDGYSFKNYSSLDGLPDGSVRCFCESRDRPGFLWIGTTWDGVYHYDGKTFRKAPNDSNYSGAVYSMIEDHEGALWCATSAGLLVIQNDHLTEIKLIDGSGVPFSVIELNDSTIIVGTEYKLLRYIRRSGRLTELDIGYEADPKLDRLLLLAKENDSTFWVTANSGIVVRYCNGLARLVHSFPYDIATFIQIDSNNNIWTGWDAGGLNRFRLDDMHSTLMNFGIENGLPENSVWAMTVDRENNLWFGTRSNGLVKLSQQYIIRFPFDKWAMKINDRSVAVDSSKHFWIATSYGLREVWRNSDGIWENYLHSVSHIPLIQDIVAIQYDSTNILWLLYRNKILEGYRVSSANNRAARLSIVRKLNLHGICRGGPPVELFVDKHNYLWCAANGEGVAVLDLSKENPVVKFFLPKENGEQYRSVGSICEDDSGHILLGTTFYGIVKLEGDIQSGYRYHSITTADGLASDQVVCILRDSKGRIWTGSDGNGATMIDKQTFRKFSRKDGLPSNTVYTIREDDVGNIWLGTRSGPAYVSPQDGWKVHVIHEMLGEIIPSIAIGPDNLIGIQTDLSFSILDMNVPRHPSSPPPIYLTDFDVDGEHIEIDDAHEFSHTSKYFMIGFLGISLRHESQLMYQYKLENIDADWREPTAERRIILAAPKAGEYKFMVRAVTPDGITSTMPAILRFTIHPPFYQQWWFVGSIFILLVVSTYGVLRRRIWIVRRERQAQQEFSRQLIDSQEQERKRIAAELHDSIGQELLIIKNRAMLGIETCPEEHPAKKELETISDISSQTIGEIREISYNLRPYQLDRLGLTKAVASLVTRTEQSFKIRISADVTVIDNLLPKEQEINIYRIVQEGLSNVVKHADASHVRLNIQKDDASVSIRIEDDGKGFDTKKTSSQSTGHEGFGLRGIGERVRILGGTFSIQSNPGRGTVLSISIPYKREKHG